jgi:hypothetical protein
MMAAALPSKIFFMSAPPLLVATNWIQEYVANHMPDKAILTSGDRKSALFPKLLPNNIRSQSISLIGGCVSLVHDEWLPITDLP